MTSKSTSSTVGGTTTTPIEIIGENIDCKHAQNSYGPNPNSYSHVAQHDLTHLHQDTAKNTSENTSTIPPFVIKATLIASLGGILFGYDMGVISGALPQLALTFSLSQESQETIVSFLYLGGGVGAAVGGTMCDFIGRKKTIIITDVLFVFGALLLYVAQSYHQILGGRLLVGFAVSVSGIADVSYLHEISPTKWRGSIVSVNEACISLGFLLAYLASYWISIIFDVTKGWRIMFGLSALVAVVQMFGMIWFMPESPVWLREQGLMVEAEEAMKMIMGEEHHDEETLKKTTTAAKEDIAPPLPSSSSTSSPSPSESLLSGKRSPTPSYDTMDEKATVATDAATDDASSSTSSSAYRNGSPQIYNYHDDDDHHHATHTNSTDLPHHPIKLKDIKEPLITALFLAISQQFVGHSNVLNYAPEILHQVGLTSPHASLGLTLCLGCIKFVVTGLVIWKIENVGRKVLLLGGMGCLMVSLGFLSVAFMGMDAIDDEEQADVSMASVILSVLGLFGVVVGYAASFGPLTWLLTSEMFPASIRGRALGMSTIVTYLSASLISYTFLSGQELLGPSGPFVIYGIICLVSWVFVLVAIPDTGGGKSPEEIEMEMRGMWWWTHFCRCSSSSSRRHHRRRHRSVRRRNQEEEDSSDEEEYEEEEAGEEEWDIEAVGLNFASTANQSSS